MHCRLYGSIWCLPSVPGRTLPKRVPKYKRSRSREHFNMTDALVMTKSRARAAGAEWIRSRVGKGKCLAFCWLARCKVMTSKTASCPCDWKARRGGGRGKGGVCVCVRATPAVRKNCARGIDLGAGPQSSLGPRRKKGEGPTSAMQLCCVVGNNNPSQTTGTELFCRVRGRGPSTVSTLTPTWHSLPAASNIEKLARKSHRRCLRRMGH